MTPLKFYQYMGAVAGLLLFVLTGIVSSAVYGGYAGVLLAGGIFGTPIPDTILARGLIFFLTMLGVAAVGAVFTVIGAAIASLVYKLTHN